MATKEVDLTAWKKRFEEAKNSRSQIEPDWYMNLAYILGDQWIFWNRGYIDRPELEDWRVKFVDNRMRPITVARVAKKTSNRPTFVCVPSTLNEQDIDSTQISEKILRYDWLNENLDYKHILAQYWVEVCGSGFWKLYWDKTQGEGNYFLHGPEGQPTMLGGSPVKKGSKEAEVYEEVYSEQELSYDYQPINAGDICIDVISPFELFPDPLAKDLDECEWIIEEKIRSKEYILQHYGEKHAASVTEDANIPVGIAESRYLSNRNASRQNLKGVKVYEAYSRPTKENPDGLCLTWAQNEVLNVSSGKESAYADYPYVMFQTDPAPGRFWPRPINSDLRAPQTDLNKMQSQIRENAIRVGNPPIAIAKEANVTWTGKIGEIVYYNDTVQNPIPKPVEMAEIPVYVREEIERIENSMREISGIHEISNAKVPSGVTAASAINLLMEADDTRLGPEIQLMENRLAIAGEYILQLRAKNMKSDGIIRIAGSDGSWDIEKYRASVLSSITGVKTQAGSAMPQSKAAKQAAMTELLNMALQYQVPLNPRAMRSFFEDYEMGGVEKLFQDLERDESQIVRENRKLYNGEIVVINIQDDDDLHIEGHEDEMKTAKFERSDPKIKAGFIAHLTLHKERRMNAANAQMEAISQEQQQSQMEEAKQQALLQQQEQHGEAMVAAIKANGAEGGENGNEETQ